MELKRIAVLQPEIPHYRKEFFRYLRDGLDALDLFVFNSLEKTKQSGFHIEEEKFQYIANINFMGLLVYNPFSLLSRKYDTLVLMLNYCHITTWLLLLTKFIHRKKIILWGQGISVKRYLKEEKKPDWKLKWMVALADGVWFYTEKELNIWKRIFPNKQMVALNNTLSGAKEMTEYVPAKSKDDLKLEYGIKEDTILIFCARFESNYRRTDLLIETIKRLDHDKFGFIIIGAGKNKPDFSMYSNVHDYGAVYETEKKQDLFAIADAYFQPGWVGLSIVEAMAYGKPVFTFKRSEETKQCVEYSYILPGENGLIFEDIEDCISCITFLSNGELSKMGKNARNLVKDNLLPARMSENALNNINCV